MNSANPAAAPPPDPIDALNDFPDRLSPIVVKELRQGLRQPSFVILFLFLQSILALAVISALFSVSSAPLQNRVQMGGVISGFFFALFALSVLVIQPLRALNALSSERRDSTIDLLLLTRLDAWRVVFGKWMSLVTQSGLIFVAILPYLLMRYFLGGMNLLGELGSLAALFLLGGMMCAAGVALSAVKSIILRVIFAIIGGIGFLVLLQSGGFYFAYSSVGGGPLGMGVLPSTSDTVLYLIGGVLLVAFITHAALEFAATRIAPPAENRSTRKRLIALTALLVIPAVFAVPDLLLRFPVYLSLAVISGVTLADALSENPRYMGRMKGISLWTLRPGWPSGAVFGLMVLGACALWGIGIAAASGHMASYDRETHAGLMQVVGVCLLMIAQPALWVALIRPHDPDPASLYLTGLWASLALGIVLLTVGTVTDTHQTICYLFFVVFPVLGFGLLDNPNGQMAAVMFICAAAYLSIAAWIGYRVWKSPAGSAPPAGPQTGPEPDATQEPPAAQGTDI